VYTPSLAELGEVHYGRKKLQPARSVVSEFYQEAESRLQFPVIRFNAEQRNEIGIAFEETVKNLCYTCYACAILRDHVHPVIRKHKRDAEAMIESFQNESRSRLTDLGSVIKNHPVWTKGGWKVFLNTPDDVWQRIRYVEGNPQKEGLPQQNWPFVVPYDNWPFHKKLNRKRK
jgi:REP element-mobilizing transposase RayT